MAKGAINFLDGGTFTFIAHVQDKIIIEPYEKQIEELRIRLRDIRSLD
jgi:hypothetical protein